MTQPWQDPRRRRPVDISAYAPPRRGPGALWLVLVGVVLVGAVVAALLARPTAPTVAPSPSATAPAGAGSTAHPGMPFAMPGNPAATGRWEVLSHAWSDAGLTVRVRVTCDTDTISYGFMAFANQGADVYQPEAGVREPEIGSGVLRAGGSITGYVFLPMPRGESTLILTTSTGRQVSALPIAG